MVHQIIITSAVVKLHIVSESHLLGVTVKDTKRIVIANSFIVGVSHNDIDLPISDDVDDATADDAKVSKGPPDVSQVAIQKVEINSLLEHIFLLTLDTGTWRIAIISRVGVRYWCLYLSTTF